MAAATVLTVMVFAMAGLTKGAAIIGVTAATMTAATITGAAGKPAERLQPGTHDRWSHLEFAAGAFRQ